MSHIEAWLDGLRRIQHYYNPGKPPILSDEPYIIVMTEQEFLALIEQVRTEPNEPQQAE